MGNHYCLLDLRDPRAKWYSGASCDLEVLRGDQHDRCQGRQDLARPLPEVQCQSRKREKYSRLCFLLSPHLLPMLLGVHTVGSQTLRMLAWCSPQGSRQFSRQREMKNEVRNESWQQNGRCLYAYFLEYSSVSNSKSLSNYVLFLLSSVFFINQISIV